MPAARASGANSGDSVEGAIQEGPTAEIPDRSAFTTARLLRGLALFVVLTAAGFWFLSRRGTSGSGLLQNLPTIHPGLLALACVPAFLDPLLGGLRIRLCATALGARIGFWPS